MKIFFRYQTIFVFIFVFISLVSSIFIFNIYYSLSISSFLEPREKISAEDAVRYILIDPESAKFRNVIHCPSGKGYYFGEVNARNKMGGYTGFNNFVANNDPKNTYIEDKESLNSDDQTFHKTVCAKGVVAADDEKHKREADLKNYLAAQNKKQQQENKKFLESLKKDNSKTISSLPAKDQDVYTDMEGNVIDKPDTNDQNRFPYKLDGITIFDIKAEKAFLKYGTTDPDGGE